MRVALVALSLGSVVVACSNDTGSGTEAQPNVFLGTWTCNVTADLTYTQPPGKSHETSTQTVQVRSNADASMQVEIVTDQGPTCPVRYVTNATTSTQASPTAGQSCTAAGIVFTYSSDPKGSLFTVDGNKMSGPLTYSFTGNATTDAGTQAVAGTGTSTYDCTRNP